MSSSWSTDELADDGQGYADGVAKSSSLVRSSILGSDGGSNPRENATEEGEVEMDVDVAREWSNDTPPPAIEGYK